MSDATVSFNILARDNATSTITGISKRFGDLRVGFASVSKGIAGAAAGAAVALVGLATAGATMGVKTAASLEQAQIGFETLLGSGQKAEGFLKDLQKFAASTPFELPGLISASRQLIGVGQSADSVIPTLTAWGDAAGALGLSQEQFERAMLATTQSMAKGKVQAEELMQITEAGIPIYPLLAKAMGKTVPEIQKLGEQGKLLAKDVFPALEAQMKKDYGGAMAKQSQTLTGLWSTFMDTLNLGLANVITPLIPALKTGLAGATETAGKALRSFGLGLNALGAAFQGEGITSDGFVGAMERIGVKAREVFDVFQTVALPRLREFGGFVTDKLVPKLGDFLGFITKWPVKVIGGLKTGFDTGNWGPLGKSIGDGFITALKGISGTVDRLGAAVGEMFDKIDWGKLGGKISGAVRGMLANVDWKGVGETLGDSVITIFQRATTLGEKVGKSFKDLMDKVDWKNIGRDSTKSIGNFIAGIDWAQLSKTLGLAVLKSLKFNFVVFNTVTQSAADLIMGMAEEIGRAIGRWFSGAGRWLEAKGKELVSGLKAGASSEAKSFGTWISQSVIQPVVSPFRNAGKWLISHGRELITGLKNGIWEFAKGLDDWMTRAPVAKLIAPWHAAGKWLLGPGKKVIGGLLQGVGDAAKNIGNWVGRNVISPTVGVFSKAGSWLVQHGKNLVAGLQNGIVSIAKSIGGWVGRNVISPTVSVFTRAGTWLVSHGRNLIAGFKNGILEIARSIGSWAYRSVIVPVVSPFARAGTWLTTEGANLIAGLKNGVVGQMKSIGTWVKANVVDPVVGAVKKFFGIRSPSTVFAGIGGHLVAGLMKGLSTTSGTAIAKKVFGDMPSALRSIVGKGLISVSNLPKKALDALGSAVGIGAPLGGPSGNQSNEGVVRTLAAQYGWATGAQWNSLRALIMGESGFRNTAQNPTSSAYGLFQFLDSTWGTVGASKTSDPWAQTVAGLKYIARSYGSPANAYAKWSSRSPHWYEKGTPWVPNDQLAYLHKGEAVVPAEVNRRAIRMPSSGGTITLRVETGGSRMDDLLVELIRRYVRVNGGDVQAVLGQ